MSRSNNTNSDKDAARPSHQTLNMARLEQARAEARARLAQEEVAIEAAMQAEQKKMEEERKKAEEARRLEQQRKEERERRRYENSRRRSWGMRTMRREK